MFPSVSWQHFHIQRRPHFTSGNHSHVHQHMDGFAVTTDWTFIPSELQAEGWERLKLFILQHLGITDLDL